MNLMWNINKTHLFSWGSICSANVEMNHTAKPYMCMYSLPCLPLALAIVLAASCPPEKASLFMTVT